ncbi:DUF4253 domain-containing protein [Sphingomonas sanxanigenens]|uniref:DUF4253 domain-containing protein n=1 Tax=Sphingomonas sanxanigenens DSM 19645 = NX02 TaxID=1123269 RepID=W0A526_9SPHN|nr:DUF4253 domain-containing protein [Sphingomonas sanxanigenens]AHE53039.1 hypothetical protein NX02_06545 [Sphingomonas sanxanigenens DSM 19645 = NX02]
MSDAPFLTRRLLLGGLGATALGCLADRGRAQPSGSAVDRLTPEQRASYDTLQAKARAAFTYERVSVPGSEALAKWEELKSSGRGWPVVIGNDEDFDRIVEQFMIEDPEIGAGPGLRAPAEILATAAGIAFPEDLRKWPGAYQPQDLLAEDGEWPADASAGSVGLSVAMDVVSQRLYERVHILLTPAKFCWKVPAYLRWGGSNACPPPEYHVAALRRWHERYGAELIGINGDVMNLRAARPPAQRAAAMTLAREVYAYCPDIVEQGTGDIAPLAAAMMANSWWYFWWD